MELAFKYKHYFNYSNEPHPYFLCNYLGSSSLKNTIFLYFCFIDVDKHLLCPS